MRQQPQLVLAHPEERILVIVVLDFRHHNLPLGVELRDREGDILVEVGPCNTTDIHPLAAPLGEDLNFLSFNGA